MNLFWCSFMEEQYYYDLMFYLRYFPIIIMQTNQSLFTYIINNKFYSFIRNSIKANHVSQDYLKSVIGNDFIILRSDPQEAILEFTYCPILAVVYGCIVVDGKEYSKGQYYQSSIEIVKLMYKKPTTLAVLYSDVVFERLERLNEILQKTSLISNLMPTTKMKLTKKELNQLGSKMRIDEAYMKYTEIKVEKGIYLFMSGIFQLLYKGIPIKELDHNFFQIRKDGEYSLRIKEMEGKYGFISEEWLEELLPEQSKAILQKITSEREDWKNNIELYPKITREKKQLIKKRMKSEKKIKIKLQKTTMIQKQLRKAFSVQVTKRHQQSASKFSLSVSLSNYSPKEVKKIKKRQMTQVDNDYKSAFQKQYDREFATIQDRLDKLRRYEKLKNKTNYKKQHWLQLNDLKKGVKMGYTQLKQQFTKQHYESMMNFKRIYITRSNSPMKTAQTFR